MLLLLRRVVMVTIKFAPSETNMSSSRQHTNGRNDAAAAASCLLVVDDGFVKATATLISKT